MLFSEYRSWLLIVVLVILNSFSSREILGRNLFQDEENSIYSDTLLFTPVDSLLIKTTINSNDSLDIMILNDSLQFDETDQNVTVIDSLNEIGNASALYPFFTKLSNGSFPVKIFQLGDSHVAGKMLPGALSRNLQTVFGSGSTTLISPKIKKSKKGKRSRKSIKRSSRRSKSVKKAIRKGTGKSKSARKSKKSGALLQTEQIHTPSFALMEQNSFNLYDPNFMHDGSMLDATSIGAKFIVEKSAADSLQFTSFGVNGKSFKYFAELPSTAKHLQAVTPDLVVISLGVNDLFGKKYDSVYIRTSVEALLNVVRENAPESAILLTYSGDAFVKKKRSNPFLPLMCEQLTQIALNHNIAYWDPIPVFGGGGYMQVWLKKQLCVRDKIHLTRNGYILFARVLSTAIIKSYQDFKANPSVKDSH